MTTEAESLRAALERAQRLIRTEELARDEIKGALTSPAEGPGDALALTAEEERTLRDHAATEDLWLSTDIWGGTMVRRLLATLDAERGDTGPVYLGCGCLGGTHENTFDAMYEAHPNITRGLDAPVGGWFFAAKPRG